MKASKNRIGAIVMIALGLGGVAAVGYYVKYAPAQKLELEELKPEYAAKRLRNQNVQTPDPVFNKKGDLEFQESKSQSNSVIESHLGAVNEFLSKLETPSPIQATEVRVDGKVAAIHFASRSEFDLGSRDEATLLLGLRAALGAFPEVDAIEIYVGGQRLDELGHELLDAPLPVIRPSNWKNPTKTVPGQYPLERD